MLIRVYHTNILISNTKKASLTPSLTSFVPPLSIGNGEGNEFAEGEERGEDKKKAPRFLGRLLIN
jgi:hypothetical protein